MQEHSYIDATHQRPEGYRPINAELVKVDTKEVINLLQDETTWAESDRNAITIYKSPQLVNTVVGLKKEAVMEKQQVEGTLNIHVLEGRLVLSSLGENRTIGKHELVWLHPGEIFTITAEENSFFILSIAAGKGEGLAM